MSVYRSPSIARLPKAVFMSSSSRSLALREALQPKFAEKCAMPDLALDVMFEKLEQATDLSDRNLTRIVSIALLPYVVNPNYNYLFDIAAESLMKYRKVDAPH